MTAIYSPEILLTPNDKLALQAVCKLLEPVALTPSGKGREATVEITLSEAQELLKTLRHLVDEGTILNNARFVENLKGSPYPRKGISQQVFEEGSKRRGKKSAMMARRWNEFLARVGYRPDHPYFSHVHAMEFSHFLKMERRLLEELRLHPAVIDLLISLVELEEQYCLELTRAEPIKRHGMITSTIMELLQSLETQVAARANLVRVPIRQLSAAALMISDSAVFFTTRDWAATGVLSANAAAVVNMTGRTSSQTRLR